MSGSFFVSKVPPCGAMLLLNDSRGRVPPCGAGSFLFAQKGTKNALGAASGERLRAAGAHSHLPPDPGYGGRPPKSRAVSSGGQNQDGLILLAPAHWGL